MYATADACFCKTLLRKYIIFTGKNYIIYDIMSSVQFLTCNLLKSIQITKNTLVNFSNFYELVN